MFVYVFHSPTLTVSRDLAIEELRRSDRPISMIIDVPRLEFDIVNLLLSNDLLQACYLLVTVVLRRLHITHLI